jgi:hypothetical protein
MACYQVNIEIMKCAGCGQLGVALVDAPEGTNQRGSLRLTNHKCSDGWESVRIQSGMIDTDEVRRFSTAVLRRVNGRMEWIRRRTREAP